MTSITFLIPTLDRSGAEKQLVLLATGLPRDRFQPEVVVLTRTGPLEEDLHKANVPVTLLGKRSRFDLRTYSTLKKRLAQQPPDILHTWLFAANSYGRLAAPRNGKLKTVVSERCVDSWKAGWQLWLDRKLIGRTDALLANSESVADFYHSQGVPKSLITVIPNGIICPGPAPLSREELLAQLNWPADTRIIGVVGRLARQKRIEDLLWGLQVLRQADPTVRMLVIGDGPERDFLRQHARDVECEGFVHFAGHQSEAARMMHLFDVYWQASSFEGMSNSLMEAMSCGIPAIVSDIPPNRELVTHGQTGYLANVGDGVAFAQYSARLFADPELKRTIGETARRHMETTFSIEAMVQRHVHLYDRLMQTGR